MYTTTMILIDAENFRYAVKRIVGEHYDPNTYDFAALLKEIFGADQAINIVFYYARLGTEVGNQQSVTLVARQRRLLLNLRNAGIQCKRAGRMQKNRINQNNYEYVEKGTDVAIATDMVAAAHQKPPARISLLSSDSDYVYAVKKAISLGSTVSYYYFEGAKTNALATIPDIRSIEIPAVTVQKHQPSNQ